MNVLGIIRSALRIAGHLAVWVGLYSAGAAVCFAHIAGRQVSLSVLWIAGTTAMGVYLFDRVKLSDGMLDPADRQAHPERFTFLSGRTRPARALAIVLGLAAMVVAAGVHPLAIAMVPCAFLGVFAYAGLPRNRRRGQFDFGRARGPRVKDILLVKNVAVAVCMTVFVGLLVVLSGSSDGDWRGVWQTWQADGPNIAVAGVFLFGLILADAILCDIDDGPADAAHGTSTLPERFGVSAAWLVAGMLYVGIGLLVLVEAGGEPLAHARRTWALLTMASVVVLYLCRPKRLRDLIDLRLPVVAVIAAAMIG